jgi:hypothetical protein
MHLHNLDHICKRCALGSKELKTWVMRYGVDSFSTVQLGTPRGRYDEYSSKVFPQ